jgi:hypothetical protein
MANDVIEGCRSILKDRRAGTISFTYSSDSYAAGVPNS